MQWKKEMKNVSRQDEVLSSLDSNENINNIYFVSTSIPLYLIIAVLFSSTFQQLDNKLKVKSRHLIFSYLKKLLIKGKSQSCNSRPWACKSDFKGISSSYYISHIWLFWIGLNILVKLDLQTFVAILLFLLRFKIIKEKILVVIIRCLLTHSENYIMKFVLI